MPRAARREDQPWLRYLVLPFVLILFGLLVSYAFLTGQKQRSVTPAPVPTATPIPTPTPTPPKYTCPENGWVNCMPILTSEAARNCTKEALAWFKANCPGFRGAAY